MKRLNHYFQHLLWSRENGSFIDRDFSIGVVMRVNGK
jgi:hypothetical protein